MNAWFYRTYFAGISVNLVESIAEDWYMQSTKKEGFWNKVTLKRLKDHQRQGHAIVLVSGSFREVLSPLAKYLSASAIFCSPLVEENGRYTGEMDGIPIIGAGKAHAVVQHLMKHEINHTSSFGYGDDPSDLAFLGCLGHPYLVVKKENRQMNSLADIIGYKKLLY